MIQKPSKCFMSEEDGSGGSSNGGAPPPPPASPPADNAASDAPLTADALTGILSSVIESKFKALENGLFANARKAGLLKQDKPADAAPVQPTTSAPSAQAGLTAADVDARMESRLELERVISTREGKYGLTESQARRLRATLSSVPRESLAAEADAYLSDMGIAKAATQTATQPTQATPPAKPNISDRGAAAPSDMRDAEGVLNSRPLEMTAHDFDDMALKHGEAKALQLFQERILSALRGVRIKPPGRR
jgi:hypothetical protein